MFKWNILLLIVITGLYSCTESEPTNQVIGTWVWSSGSRIIKPEGFERLHRDRSETYLVGDAEFYYIFEEQGSFESTYTLPGKPTTFYSGNWRSENGQLFLDYLDPVDFTGISQYRVPSLDASNLDLQWSVEYREFTDAQIEQWREEGIITSNGWTVDRESLLESSSSLIEASITLHFVKVE